MARRLSRDAIVSVAGSSAGRVSEFIAGTSKGGIGNGLW
ncbi:hypothetical protein Y023_4847 [Burkholderia pseudomallei A79D]|nr:hypothetical protein DO65_6241 [Burkholderia pseudomallei]KGW39269.1 hypothetical protein Y597_6078 [Burkholderia pseudomallei MSHR1000]KGX97138.1 hypothetical protein Y023_4847 [Burkholderia pseudomallei A79D]KGX98027.1 hypothetical protein X997_4562 [Burkholderia pseudomallei A79C]KOT02078.1 hypothetical protein DM50_3056 [Burkholderia mallei]